MGSHYVRIYSIDEGRLRAAVGSENRNTLTAWLAAIRAHAGQSSKADVKARERAAEQLVNANVQPGKRDDGHHFGFAFLALCEAWADQRALLECYVTETFPALWALAACASPNPFGVPQCPYGIGHVGWHTASAIPKLRRDLAAIRAGDTQFARFGGTAENVAALDTVLAHAEEAGYGVVVSWAA